MVELCLACFLNQDCWLVKRRVVWLSCRETGFGGGKRVRPAGAADRNVYACNVVKWPHFK